MREILVRVHRYVGLLLTLPLFVAGLGGAVIAFQQEIDAALNPAFFQIAQTGPALAPGVLAARIEAQAPDAEVVFMPLERQAGQVVRAYVLSRAGAQPLAFDEVAADPATGGIVGRRLWGKASLAPENIVSFIYRLHFSLALGDVGTWIMGIAAMFWLFDAFIGLALTLPRRGPWWARWTKAWRVKTSAGSHRAVFDLHRAGGLWPWLLLVVLATSAIQMNLSDQVFRPVVAWFGALSPSPRLETAPAADNTARRVGWDEALRLALARAAGLGWTTPAGWIQWDREHHTYRVGFNTRDPDAFDDGTRRELRVDDLMGEVTVTGAPDKRTSADVFVDLQYPLHTGRLGGRCGRIIVSLTGVAVASLALTGVYLFWRRHRSRVTRRKARPAQSPSG